MRFEFKKEFIYDRIRSILAMQYNLIPMKSLVPSILILVLSSQLLAWGPTGHRVIGQVAENHLSKNAKKEVEKLLGHQSLAQVSTWMDEIRSDEHYDHTHNWHYTTIPDGSTYENRNNDQGLLVEKIEEMIETLQCAESSKESKIRSLKFLVHLVGDLGQPLHVGNGEDRGGNNVKVQFFYEPSNLHRVWDSGIIDHKLYSYTELASIIDHVDDAQIAAWTKGSVSDWANECVQYREQVYDIGDPERLGYQYEYKNWDLVKQQLVKSGVRLASILNEIYS